MYVQVILMAILMLNGYKWILVLNVRFIVYILKEYDINHYPLITMIISTHSVNGHEPFTIMCHESQSQQTTGSAAFRIPELSR